jgi:nucleoside-diphosphate-sugar epimerase
MRIIVIGGSGHIGTYLIPRLVLAGHHVIVVSRGKRQPYQPHPAWNSVQWVETDRTQAEKDGTFGKVIRQLKPDVVMDMLCFTVESARHLAESLQGEIQLFVHCGTIWVRGHSVEIPAAEHHSRNPISEYGVRKNGIETYLLDQARRKGFPAVVLHPGHIVGPGWIPVGPTACHDPKSFERLLRGEEVILPNLGMETLHHVHADDVAQAFVNTLLYWNGAVGESFFVVSPAALTLRGFAEGLAARFGISPNIRYLPFDEWLQTLPEEFREGGKSHVLHSSNASIQKARQILDYAPRYSSLAAVEESVRWLIENGQVKI